VPNLEAQQGVSGCKKLKILLFVKLWVYFSVTIVIYSYCDIKASMNTNLLQDYWSSLCDMFSRIHVTEDEPDSIRRSMWSATSRLLAPDSSHLYSPLHTRQSPIGNNQIKSHSNPIMIGVHYLFTRCARGLLAGGKFHFSILDLFFFAFISFFIPLFVL